MSLPSYIYLYVHLQSHFCTKVGVFSVDEACLYISGIIAGKRLILFVVEGFFHLFFFYWILNHCLALKLQGMNWSPDILLLDFLVESRIHGFIIHSKSSGSWSSKATHNHDTITRSDCWYEVLLPKYCVSFTNRQVLFPSFFWFLINMHIFSQIHLWRIQII